MSDFTSKQHSQRVSMESIAKELGISIATVSRVLNEKPGISEEVRRKVWDLLKKRSYKRRSSKGKKSKSGLQNVGFLISDYLLKQIHQGNDFYGRHFVAIQRAISEAGFYPLMIGVDQDINSEGKLRCVVERRVQAIIAENYSTDLMVQTAQEIPVVLFNRISASAHVDTVTTDMHAATQETLEYLYELGHRCIASFRISETHGSWEDICFWQQYYSFAKKHALSLPDSILKPIHFGMNEHWEAAREFVSRILSGTPRPTAILSYDVYMPALWKALEEQGLKVPDEMSLFGFNDTKEASEVPISLTTYRQDFDALAQEAMRLILDRIERGDCPARLVRMPGKLIERASCVRVARVEEKEI